MKYLSKILLILCLGVLSLPVAVHAQHKEADERLLQAASEGDQPGLLRALLDTASVNAVTSEGVTALMYAAQRGDADMVNILLFNGADPDIVPANGYNALMSACAAGFLEVAETLIRSGSEVNVSDENGVTSLMYAAAYNQWVVCDMLLFYKAEVNKKDHDSIDALMAASYMGNIEVAGLLIKHGANPLSANEKGVTALWYALKKEHTPIIDTLLKSGADPNARFEGEKAMTPVFYAKYHRDYDNYVRLKKAGGKSNLIPFIPQWLINIDVADFNGKDYMCGLGAGIFEGKSATSVVLGFSTRLAKNKILEQVSDHYYYQLREGRGSVYLQAQKMFRLPWGRVRFQYGPFVGGRLAYTFGHYAGMERKVDDQWLFSPQLGFALISGAADVRAYYAYMNFGTLNLSPHRVGVSLVLHINFRRDDALRRIFWINEVTI